MPASVSNVEGYSDGFWLRIHRRVKERFTDCRGKAEPLEAARAELRQNWTKPSAVVFMPFPKGPPDRYVYGSLGNREFDARQVRLLISALKHRCYLWLDEEFSKASIKTEEDRGYAEELKPFARGELDWLEAFSEIAQRLEKAERPRVNTR